ncbi:MAG: helix-turn-helix domain-containing protein [Opitutaceae bacterium]
MGSLTFICLAGALVASLLALRLVFSGSENRAAAQALAGFLGCAAVFVLYDSYLREGWFEQCAAPIGWFEPFILAIGPFFFLYARATTEPAFRWRWRHVAHFSLPLLLVLLALATSFLPREERLADYRQLQAQLHGAPRPAFDLGALVVLNLYHLSYLGAALLRLWRWRERIAEEQEEGRTHPVRGIGLFATIVFLVGLGSAVLDFSPWTSRPETITSLAIVLVVFGLHWSFSQPQPFIVGALPSAVPLPPPQPEPSAIPADAEPQDPRAASSVSEEPAPPPPAPETAPAEPNAHEIQRLAERVRHLLEVERAFLEPDLSLHELATRAHTTRHKLSATLRAAFGMSFYQLISSHRVAEAARVLRTPEGKVRTIADIAFGAGFNTLSSFNAAFRARFGVTPSEFRDRPAADSR